MFCAISGVSPINPVVSKVTGHVYEKDLIFKYIRDNEGRDPITGATLTEDDLLPIKTSPSAPTTAPRPAQFNSIPSLLAGLQNEWDTSMLEVFELRKQASSLRQELSHALYKEDAAMRVLARIMRERDEARQALANMRASMGLSGDAPSGSAQAGGDVDMDAEAAPAEQSPFPAPLLESVKEVEARLSGSRKQNSKKPAPEGYATAETLKTLAQETTIPSMHSTKPPGMSSLDISKDGQLLVTGGLDKNVIVYDRETSKTLATLKGHTKKVTSAVFIGTAEGDDLPYLIASSSLDKTVRLFSTDTSAKAKASYAVKATISSHSGEVNGLAVHPCNTLIASAGQDGWAFHDITDPAKPNTFAQVALPEEVAGTTCAFHGDGNLLAVGAENGKIYVYDTKSLAFVATFEDERSSAPVTSLSFSENGYILASASGNSGFVWDLRKQKVTAQLSGGESDETKVISVSWDKTAQFLLCAGSSVKVWQNKSWNEPLCTLEENASDLYGAAWAKEGKEVIVAGLDRTVRIFAPKSK